MKSTIGGAPSWMRTERGLKVMKTDKGIYIKK
jgi:hypothetical protein